jgi:hypothetical protein
VGVRVARREKRMGRVGRNIVVDVGNSGGKEE